MNAIPEIRPQFRTHSSPGFHRDSDHQMSGQILLGKGAPTANALVMYTRMASVKRTGLLPGKRFQAAPFAEIDSGLRQVDT